MTTDASKVPAPKPETKPEHSLPFATPRRGDDVWNLWGKPTSDNWWLAEVEGQMRAIAVLNLDIDREKPGERAAALGRIFASIARAQFERRRSFIEISAIADFWGLIGELAAAYTTRENIGYAAKVVCRRAAGAMIHHTELLAETAPHRRRVKTTKLRKARKR